MRNWYIGQEIVCIDDTNQYVNMLKLDEVYTINGILASNGEIGLTVVGIDILSITNRYRKAHNSNRFKPLDEIANISELTAILEKEIFEV